MPNITTPYTSSKTQATTKTMGDRTPAWHFVLEIPGVSIGHATEIGGISMETEVHKYRDSDDPQMHARPARHKVGRLKVKRLFKNEDTWFKHRQTVLDGLTKPVSISVVLMKDGGPLGKPTEVGRFNFFNSWPTLWRGPQHHANTSAHAHEELEFAFDYVQWKPA